MIVSVKALIRGSALALLLAHVGCGSGDPWSRIRLSGHVKIAEIANSQEIEGTVTLNPAGETKGPSATAEIKGGKYQFERASGPVAGKHVAVLMILQPRSLITTDPTLPLNPKTDPNVKQSAQTHFFPEKKLDVVVPASRPFELDLSP